MSADIGLFWNAALMRADIAVTNGDIALDYGLQTAVTVSLLSDRQALPGDVLPDDKGPRGWWGDAFWAQLFGLPANYRIGSRLWLLRRTTLTQTTLNLAQDYAMEALQWMLDDEVAGAIGVVATATGVNAMNLAVTMTQKGGAAVYNVVWQGQASGLMTVAA